MGLARARGRRCWGGEGRGVPTPAVSSIGEPSEGNRRTRRTASNLDRPLALAYDASAPLGAPEFPDKLVGPWRECEAVTRTSADGARARTPEEDEEGESRLRTRGTKGGAHAALPLVGHFAACGVRRQDSGPVQGRSRLH